MILLVYVLSCHLCMSCISVHNVHMQCHTVVHLLISESLLVVYSCLYGYISVVVNDVKLGVRSQYIDVNSFPPPNVPQSLLHLLTNVQRIKPGEQRTLTPITMETQ